MDEDFSIMESSKIKFLLKIFPPKHIDAALRHYIAASNEFKKGNWDGVALKAGKFVEAITKALTVFCGKIFPPGRKFKAGILLQDLQKLNSSAYDDTIRIVIPKGCLFVYEIVNNRGGRHDPHEIDANLMDMNVVLPTISWILAELIRFACGEKDHEVAMTFITSLSKKTYPFSEEIDNRLYINMKNQSAFKVALLILYFKYPQRISRMDLIDSVVRNGYKKNNAVAAVHRLKKMVDDNNGALLLRTIGQEEAEKILSNSK